MKDSDVMSSLFILLYYRLSDNSNAKIFPSWMCTCITTIINQKLKKKKIFFFDVLCFKRKYDDFYCG